MILNSRKPNKEAGFGGLSPGLEKFLRIFFLRAQHSRGVDCIRGRRDRTDRRGSGHHNRDRGPFGKSTARRVPRRQPGLPLRGGEKGPPPKSSAAGIRRHSCRKKAVCADGLANRKGVLYNFKQPVNSGERLLLSPPRVRLISRASGNRVP